MSLSLILAVTLMPAVTLLLLLGLAVTWLCMHRASHDDVVDLVAMQKPITPDLNYENRTSTEPFPQLPPIGLDDTGKLMDSSSAQAKNSGDLIRTTHHPTEPSMTAGRTSSNTLITPPKRFNILSESPSTEALAAFDFADTPSRPPVPARSLKRSSGRSLIPVPTTATATPTIKIEPASPSNPSLLFPQTDNQPLHLSPTAIGRAHARQTIEAIEARTHDTVIPPIPSSSSHLFSTSRNTPIRSSVPVPFSSVPITHITSPISDNLPPTPARSSTYLTTPTKSSSPTIPTHCGPTPYNTPNNPTGMHALRANRSMMEIEARLASTTRAKDDKENTAVEVAGLLGRKKSGVNMHGKRNSAIREYVRGFPEQNPWRRLIGREKGRVEDFGIGIRSEDGEDEEEEFMRRFGVVGGMV